MPPYLEYYREKKIAIPGGEGFFGSHITDRLKENKIYAAVGSRRSGYDFRELNDCRRFYEKEKPDIVINCAANQGGIGYHSGKQGELFMDNMLMGMHLMRAAQEAGVKKFINIVAGCAYPGYLEKDELNEEDFYNGNPHETIFSYGYPRRASAVFGLALEKQFNFNSIHLVYANMYGPREHFEPSQSKALAGLMKKFYDAKKSGASSVEVWGTGKPVRDWLYVKDGVEGLLRAGAAYNDIEPLNIATGVGISVADLARTVQKVVGYAGEIKFNTEKPDGALKKTFGIHKMQKTLGWVPQVPLEQGITETIAWLDTNYDYAVTH